MRGDYTLEKVVLAPPFLGRTKVELAPLSSQTLGGRILIAGVWALFWIGICFIPGRLLGYDQGECTAALMVTSIVMVPFILLYITIGAGTGEDPKTTPPIVKRHIIKRQS